MSALASSVVAWRNLKAQNCFPVIVEKKVMRYFAFICDTKTAKKLTKKNSSVPAKAQRGKPEEIAACLELVYRCTATKHMDWPSNKFNIQ